MKFKEITVVNRGHDMTMPDLLRSAAGLLERQGDFIRQAVKANSGCNFTFTEGTTVNVYPDFAAEKKTSLTFRFSKKRVKK